MCVWSCACCAGNQSRNKRICDQLSSRVIAWNFQLHWNTSTGKRLCLKLRHSTWSIFLFAIIIAGIIGILLCFMMKRAEQSFVFRKVYYSQKTLNQHRAYSLTVLRNTKNYSFISRLYKQCYIIISTNYLIYTVLI